ncbi:Putative 37S ribosomal protein S18, mitochondrial [Leucoagaricus sp. SymC.cos]|nr:Putative 37S ribosomal protein S18, mitochondrial [Leucoagaricus sp. SymC.cos]
MKLAETRASYRFDCYSTRNNTITTLSSLTYSENAFAPPKANVIAWYSGGSVGFKKGQRSGYEAGYQCAVRIFKLLEEHKAQNGADGVKVDLYFRGFGQGREALKTALMATEGDTIRDTIKRVIDRTALKIGGTRSKKTRRL